MKLMVTVQQCVYLWCFLSTAVFHSVSAGGAYCAKTARARAAALGLPYPGVHGAPDLSAPTHHEMQRPGTFSYGAYAEPHMDWGIRDQPRASPFHDVMYKQVHPRGSEGLLQNRGSQGFLQNRGSQFPHGYSGFPRRLPVRTPESSFEEVKHAAPSQLSASTLNPRSRAHSLPFAYGAHDLGVDESAPNRHGVPLSRLPLPRSWGHPADKKHQTKKGSGRKVPFFRSSRPSKKGKGKKRAPVRGRWKMILLPVHLGQHLPKLINSKEFVPGKAVVQTRPDYNCDPNSGLCSARLSEG
ncbi:uncharacterized protein LOC119409930 isoform X2 [Nematolebias whitei]|uniref:uncharacterized protein LOC119409930 isoform X2 n=1 Tax=Nematolebias whitei TaxID=451745 RepID=UPI001898E0D2|nr:uncharacterized protein LOC119409930 isoform X2 [Nematolebias whitei]